MSNPIYGITISYSNNTFFTKVFDNKSDFAKEIFRTESAGLPFKCFEGKYIDTPEVTVEIREDK